MSTTRNVQSWNSSLRQGEAAVAAVTDFLLSTPQNKLWFETVLVHDVQDKQNFQLLGIDLLWFVRAKQCNCCLTVEVKGDTYSKTGNFFLETVSDVERETEGAFLSTTAEWYFYYFLPTKFLYCIPIPLARPWFLENLASFEERTAHSNRNGSVWSTVGRLVPIAQLLDAIEEVRCYRKDEATDEWCVA